MNYFRSIMLAAILSVGFFLSSNESKADCTLTSKPGTNGRCFMENGDYTCLKRAEDTNCSTGVVVE